MSEKIIIPSEGAPAPIGPYSQAVMAGNTLYISGQIPLDPSTGLIVVGNIEAETKQVMDNIGAILKAYGMGFEHIVKTTIFILNMDDFGRINAAYGSYFTSAFPARETVQVARLPKDVPIEISCIAVK